ncbi:MAG: competence/damage-inducible protein A [Clostridia bacterium]|nr:competence/damage-inducible protein A [Clostridia bacterium]
MNNIKNAEILCVGYELLHGDVVNTNAAYLSEKLDSIGITVTHHTVVGDEPAVLMSALSAAFERVDLVVTSGGLGPTYDDLTKETVAKYFGREMKMHTHSLERITDYFARSGRIMTRNNEKQAMMPEGATVFDNDYGTAPSLAIEDATLGKTVIMLPGPPSELCPIFSEKAMPYLKSRSHCAIFYRNIHFFGIGESALEEKLGDLMTNSQNPTVAPYCKEGEVRLRVTAKADSENEAIALCDAMTERIKDSSVGEYIYGVDTDTLEEAVVRELKKHGLTLSAAESCTGGLIARRVTDISGASSVFLGGCVTYTNEIKEKLLGVSHETLESFGAVSKETAVEMAIGVRRVTGSDIAVSATGLAGPSGGSDELPVGTVFIGISTKKGEKVRKLTLSARRSREYIRQVSASNALHMVLEYLKNIEE